MPSASEKVFANPELLELILLKVKPGEILVNAQGVSKKWKEAIEKSHKIQRALFFEASPSASPYCPLRKNEMLRFDTDRLDAVTSYLHHKGRESASWRNMQIAAPPITVMQWEIYRGEWGYHQSTYKTIVEFEFPEGLRMGTLWDFVVGTRGAHYITWPAPRLLASAGLKDSAPDAQDGNEDEDDDAQDSDDGKSDGAQGSDSDEDDDEEENNDGEDDGEQDSDEEDEDDEDDEDDARSERTIVVGQRVILDATIECQDVDLWPYRHHLRKIEELGFPSFILRTLPLDNDAAMREFEEAAQNPIREGHRSFLAFYRPLFYGNPL
ncbi:hypothetical protein F5Y13DRAFT_203714 [Hypoxylon sp. FL1857]|nr:hypothetical protein F5Y13DRAFT_203714 [Hypoxylon sp. FL1857]